MSASLSITDVPSRAHAPLTIPVERGLPILGVLPAMLRDAPGLLGGAARRQEGRLFSIRLGPVTIPVVSQPDLVQQVLVDRARDFTKGGMWEATRPLLGNGLVTSEGDFWMRQRRLMQPLFGPKHLNTLGERMTAAVEREVDRLVQRARQDVPVEIGAEMTQITQRVLLETMFSTSLGESEAAGLAGHLGVAFEQMNTRLFLYFLPRWVPLPGDRIYRRALAALDEGLQGLVAARRRSLVGGSDLLSLLLGVTDADTGERMSDRQIRDELITLFVAGLDTTAVTLTWLFWLLDQHPEVDRRLRAEVAEVLGERPATVADLPHLGYTRRVIQEAMRLYPPAWIFPRYSPAETMLGDYRIPAGTTLLLSPYVTHRDPALWERPEAFDPDRFTQERSAGRPRYAYYPFGGGGRQCIGNHFAMMEAQLIVARVVQRLRLQLQPGHVVAPSAASTLKPRHGMQMLLRPA